MWGWKSIERIIEPSVSLREATGILVGQGFRVHASNPHHVILKSAGTENPWTTPTPAGENVPIELAIAESHNGLFMHLRYETFVLFDTGDLERFADSLATSLTSQSSTT